MGRRIVLIVERRAGDSRAVWAPLTAAGFEVVVAASEDEAHCLVERRLPSAVVIDAALPLHRLRDLFLQIRRCARERDPELAVLLVNLEAGASRAHGPGRRELRSRALVALVDASLREPGPPARSAYGA